MKNVTAALGYDHRSLAQPATKWLSPWVFRATRPKQGSPFPPLMMVAHRPILVGRWRMAEEDVAGELAQHLRSQLRLIA
jgi:hypothetical protein